MNSHLKILGVFLWAYVFISLGYTPKQIAGSDS